MRLKLNPDLNVEYGRLKDSEGYMVLLISKEKNMKKQNMLINLQ